MELTVRRTTVKLLNCTTLKGLDSTEMSGEIAISGL